MLLDVVRHSETCGSQGAIVTYLPAAASSNLRLSQPFCATLHPVLSNRAIAAWPGQAESLQGPGEMAAPSAFCLSLTNTQRTGILCGEALMASASCVCLPERALARSGHSSCPDSAVFHSHRRARDAFEQLNIKRSSACKGCIQRSFP